jgi:hypothetical protein
MVESENGMGTGTTGYPGFDSVNGGMKQDAIVLGCAIVIG